MLGGIERRDLHRRCDRGAGFRGLVRLLGESQVRGWRGRRRWTRRDVERHARVDRRRAAERGGEGEIGRASCRERVEISVVAVSLKKKEGREGEGRVVK